MQTHVKVLAVLHIVMGAFGVLVGVGLFALFGGIGAIAGVAGESSDALLALPILGAVGGILLILMLTLALPGLIAGIGLLSFRPWARILTIVLSVLNLLNFPFGTALGVYGLWVLLSQEGATLFGRAEPAPYPHYRG